MLSSAALCESVELEGEAKMAKAGIDVEVVKQNASGALKRT
jgi:hypothetical protein